MTGRIRSCATHAEGRSVAISHRRQRWHPVPQPVAASGARRFARRSDGQAPARQHHDDGRSRGGWDHDCASGARWRAKRSGPWTWERAGGRRSAPRQRTGRRRRTRPRGPARDARDQSVRRRGRQSLGRSCARTWEHTRARGATSSRRPARTGCCCRATARSFLAGCRATQKRPSSRMKGWPANGSKSRSSYGGIR